MDNIYLTVKEVSELKGCTERYVQRLITNSHLKAEIVEVKGVGPGRGGVQYRVPLTTLDKKLQVKYKRQQRGKVQMIIEDEPALETETIDYERITAAEREQIAFWKSVIREWDLFRATAASKAEGDERFVIYMKEKWKESPPPFKVNLNLCKLYRKRKALYTEGDCGLIDGRGKHNNHVRKLTEEMFDVFEFYYLHRSQKTVSLCRFLTGEELKRRYENEMPLPSSDTFERAAKNIPIPYIKWFREGTESFISDCAPYIKRMYDNLEPNDIWVADGHTFDIMVDKDGKPIRIYLTAFMDVRTRKMMGWVVTNSLGSDATIFALKKGVEAYGLPKAILTDNGREYLFHDFGGNGFRKKAELKPGEFKLPTILEDLGIEFRTALPKNARAKGIERAFETIKETFSKLFVSYTGGNVLERPEELKHVVKRPGLIPKVEKFIGYVDTYIAGFYNKQPHRGEGMNGRSPDEVFAELLFEKRVVPKDKLNLMFMRYSKGTIKVGKNGVSLKFYGMELQYFTADLWREYFGQDVYVRYSPDDLSSVRVYNTDKQLICEAPLKTKLGFNATKENVQALQKENNAATKAVKNYKKTKGVEAQDALDAVLNKAAGNLETPENISPKVFRLLQSGEEILPKAAGAANEFDEPINWTDAIQRLKAERFNNK